MKAAREAWFAAQPDLDADKLVFLDETAAATNMARRYGRAPRGERCHLLVPHCCASSKNMARAARPTACSGACTRISGSRPQRPETLPRRTVGSG